MCQVDPGTYTVIGPKSVFIGVLLEIGFSWQLVLHQMTEVVEFFQQLVNLLSSGFFCTTHGGCQGSFSNIVIDGKFS